MRTLGAADLMDLWEQGGASRQAERAHLLLDRVHPELSPGELDALPLGRRDELLLQLRERIFGPRLESVVCCPNCRESLEIKLDTRELRSHPAAGEDLVTEWTRDDLRIRFRLPSSGDLRDLQQCGDREAIRRSLLQRCVVEARRDGEPIEPARLTREETAALGEHLARVDPGAELMLSLDCPNCGHAWETSLDIASFLWQELDMEVRRLLAEVHVLAWSYSWNERDILAMSGRRRRIYLELLGR